MRCGHLFNGISGFGLAASWMGWENLMHCEIDPFCNRVMKYHFPNSFQHEDIRTTDFGIWRGRIDLITGGFPCQPASTAGKRSGKEDDRWLWPETKRAIVEIQPRIIVLENVNGLISLLEPASFTDVESQAVRFYNREHLLFKIEHKKRDKIEIGLKAIQERITAQIIKEIEAEGYLLPRTAKGIPIVLCIPACGVGAPHRRDRIWLIAYAAGNSCNNEPGIEGQESCEVQEERSNESFLAADPLSLGQPGSGWTFNPGGTETDGNWKASWAYDDGRWPTESPVCPGNDGLSAGLVDITFSKWREESLKAMGNAIVPQVALEIFKAIQQYEIACQTTET